MYDLEEQEKIDALKAWWRENGKVVIAAIVAAALAAGSVVTWRTHQARKVQEAAHLYAGLEEAARGDDATKLREAATALMDKYPNTAYGAMAALIAAKSSFDQGDLKSAGAQLQWAMEHAKDEETKAVARLRLAAVRLDEEQFAEALQLLDAKHPAAFAGLYADLRGDVLLAQGKAAEARSAYQDALAKLPEEGSYRLVVQAKLDALGGS
ncbi:MAG: tetratricopeptide repeat protein [Burkholderiales bacterium]|nr:tetratricopeptide repeat protein [Burkholderiales bacterium]